MMFYRPADGHGLPHNPFKAIVSPRPIAWVSTRGAVGDNLAPYSFFNAVADQPPQVMFASTGVKPDRPHAKDTADNIRDTGVYCVNIVAFDARDAMNQSSGPWPATTDEFVDAGIPKADCNEIDCPRVADAPAAMECRLIDILTLRGEANLMILGEVVGFHIRDDALVDGILDVTRYRPVARLGYRDYASVDTVFTLRRPGSAR